MNVGGPADGDMDRAPLAGACASCGHDAGGVPSRDIAAALVATGRDWQHFLSTVTDHPGGRDGLRVRPGPDRWSAVEYGCHVRDLLALAARRIELALLMGTPSFDSWDHEAEADAAFYREQDPLAVADDIEHGAIALARLHQRIDAADLKRIGVCNGHPLTIEHLAAGALHEALHHLADARSVVPAAA